tara:strand:+ start:410 stop:613 length:204 start_codon:yes stop_codon:yes gene_type:complete
MMEHTSVYMENSENLLDKDDGNPLFYNSRKKCVMTACLLILSYGLSYGLGVYTGYKANNCDGSESLF